MKTFPLTVGMTPAFKIGPGDWLLRAQLRCLSEQAFKDFAVYLIDPHYSKRASYIPELAAHYKLNVVHVPYKPNQRVASRLDCAVFNAPYLFSESPRIVRYSCWRFVRPDFTKICVESKTNVDFRFHSIQPQNFVGRDDSLNTNHPTDIWSPGSDVVNWDKIPTKAGMGGATWGEDADRDAPETLMPLNAYGNYCVSRKDWFSINGTDEVFSRAAHYEDMDFTQRAHNAGIKCERKCHVLYRLSHNYGNHSGRSNEPTDYPLTKNCDACEAACHVLEPKRFDLARRHAAGEIEFFNEHKVWVCRKCLLAGPIYSVGCHEHTEWIKSSRRTQATIIPKFKHGRNLRILAADMDGKSLSEKVEIFERSYSDPKYYEL